MNTPFNTDNSLIQESRDKFTSRLANNNVNTLQEATGDNQALHNSTEVLETSKATIEKYRKLIAIEEQNLERAETSIAEIKGKSIQKQKETQNKVPELEEENFRIDSSNWETIQTNAGKVKINPQGDAWEYLEGEFKGEQKFTQDAAIRETSLAGKEMPSPDQWFAIVQSIDPTVIERFDWQNNTTIREKLKMTLSGYLDAGGGVFGDLGGYGYFWSSERGQCFKLDATRVCPVGGGDPSHGVSVRCLRKN